LQQLEILGALDIVPRERVAAIRSGKGPLDTARDAVAIAGMYTDDEFAAAVANKHPFTPAQLRALADDGNWLVGQLNPKGAGHAKPGNASPPSRTSVESSTRR